MVDHTKPRRPVRLLLRGFLHRSSGDPDECRCSGYASARDQSEEHASTGRVGDDLSRKQSVPASVCRHRLLDQADQRRVGGGPELRVTGSVQCDPGVHHRTADRGVAVFHRRQPTSFDRVLGILPRYGKSGPEEHVPVQRQGIPVDYIKRLDPRPGLRYNIGSSISKD